MFRRGQPQARLSADPALPDRIRLPCALAITAGAARRDKLACCTLAPVLVCPSISRIICRLVMTGPMPGSDRIATYRADGVLLPTPLTSLIGRDAEVRTVLDLLDQEYPRLLTLTGP